MKKTRKPVVKTVARKPKKAVPAKSPASKKKVSVKQLAKREIHRNRPVHKKIALHPISGFALLLVGVFLATWTFQTFAASTTISATIEAPALTSAATITSPTDGDTVSASALTVTGSCPGASYVNLTINGTFSGTDMCTSGSYSILTSLVDHDNTLQVQDYNLTDVAGPTTPTIAVTYTDGMVLGASTTKQANPLILTSDFKYRTYSTAENFKWPLTITGGTKAYTLSSNWQDGNKPTITVTQLAASLNILHHFKYSGYYVVHLQLVDGGQAVRLLQLGALITAPGSSFVPGISTPTKSAQPEKGFAQTKLGNYLTQTRLWLWIAWPSFIVVTLMIFSFWLGERQEYQDIFSRVHTGSGRRRSSAKHRRRFA